MDNMDNEKKFMDVAKSLNGANENPMYERMDLTRAGFSNQLIYTFLSGLNFSSNFCDGPSTDMEPEKPEKNKSPECPKDKNIQFTFGKMVSLPLECNAVGIEYFNANTGTSPWVAGLWICKDRHHQYHGF